MDYYYSCSSSLRYLSLSSSIPSSKSSLVNLQYYFNNNNNNNNRKKKHIHLNNNNNISSISTTTTVINNKEKEEEEEEEEDFNSNGDSGGLLTARERRQLRNEKRALSSSNNNWREQVEERLLNNKIPKKRYASWTEELNLDNLSLLGPQWWVVRVSRSSSTTLDAPETLARALSRNFPNIDFKVYAPAVRVKRKLKNGTISVKPKPIFPGCVFLRCVLNKDIHDFIREIPGVAGFVGSKVGNTKRQINRPKPVSSHDLEEIFRQAKEEQDKTDQAFEQELAKEGDDLTPNSKDIVTESVKKKDVKLKRQTKKGVKPIGTDNPALLPGEDVKLLVPGSSIRVMSGPFMEFTGSLKKLDRKTGKATVGFMLFGKESLVKLDVNQIVVETSS